MHFRGSQTVPVLTLFALAVAVTLLHTPVLAAGDGSIVIQRELQPRVAFRQTMVPDPHPATVNPNVSPQINRMIDSTELSDGDFAQITSGNRISQIVAPDGHLRALGSNTPGSAQGVPGLNAGHAGGGNSISSQVNRSVQQGLAPLGALSGGR